MTWLQRTAEQVSLLSSDTSLPCLHSSYSGGSTQPSFRHSKLFGRQFLTLAEPQPPSWVAKKAIHLIHKKQWGLLECLPLLSVKHKIKLTKSFWNSTRQQFPWLPTGPHLLSLMAAKCQLFNTSSPSVTQSFKTASRGAREFEKERGRVVRC